MASRKELDDQLDAVELLGEPVRRELYLHVARQPGEVSRDEAAAAVSVSRELAAFHLDKLVRAKLLEPVFRRLSGRTGPGAGRPSKLYRRAPGEIAISLPQREYELAAQIFARALGLPGRDAAPEALSSAARDLGSELGRQAKVKAGRGASQRRLRDGLIEALEAQGYEPFTATNGKVRLRNCPFHSLARDFQQPVCGMNLAFIEGLTGSSGVTGMRPRLEPADDYCCVSFETAK